MSEKSSIKTGDTYNPFKIFIGLFIPNCIAKSTKLSPSAKLCFGRLSQFAGSNGKCFPKQQTLANEIGLTSLKQIRRCLQELEINKLIKCIKPTGKDKLLHKPNTYVFIWNNELFTGEKDGNDSEKEQNDFSKNIEKSTDQNGTSEGDINVPSAADINVPSKGRESLLNVESNNIKAKAFNTNSKKQNLTEDFFQDKPLQVITRPMPKLNQTKSIDSLDVPPITKKNKDEEILLVKNCTSESKPIIKISHAQHLRDSAKSCKSMKSNKPKKKQHQISKMNQLFWDVMIESNLRVPKLKTADIYKRTDEIITKLRRGTYFDHFPGCEHLIRRQITIEDFTRFYKHFKLAVESPLYMPNKIEVKNAWKSWYLDRIMYNSDSQNKCKSLFATYLDDPPPRIKSKIVNEDPEYTDVIIDLFQKHCNLDLSNEEKHHAILCAKELTKFFADNRDKILYYDSQYMFLYQQVEALIETLVKHSPSDKPINPIYLHSNLTYSKFLPDHLKEINAMRM